MNTDIEALEKRHQDELAQIAAWQQRTRSRIERAREIAVFETREPWSQETEALAHRIIRALDGAS